MVLQFWSKSLSSLKGLISNVNGSIFLLDLFKEFWSLSLTEWTSFTIFACGIFFIKEHVFCKNASITYRHNYIAMLQKKDQVEVSEPDGKAYFFRMLSRNNWFKTSMMVICSSFIPLILKWPHNILNDYTHISLPIAHSRVTNLLGTDRKKSFFSMCA